MDAVGAFVAGVAEAFFGACGVGGIDFEIGAGEVVEEDIELGSEEVAPFFGEVAEEVVIVGEDAVVDAVEGVLFDEGEA